MIDVKKGVFSILLIFCFQASLFAHYIWIETESTANIGATQVIKIFYGEFNEGLREIQGGRLEEVEGIVCMAIAPNGEKIDLKVTKLNTYYEVKFTPEMAGIYSIIAVNKVREVVDWSKYGIGIVKPTYYSHKQITVDTDVAYVIKNDIYPELILVPYTKEGNSKFTYQLLYNNKPLAKTKLFVHAPNEWSKEYKTNEKGIFDFDPLWKGVYVIECIYKEKGEGVYLGKNYEAIRHRVTYTLQNN